MWTGSEIWYVGSLLFVISDFRINHIYKCLVNTTFDVLNLTFVSIPLFCARTEIYIADLLILRSDYNLCAVICLLSFSVNLFT